MFHVEHLASIYSDLVLIYVQSINCLIFEMCIVLYVSLNVSN